MKPTRVERAVLATIALCGVACAAPPPPPACPPAPTSPPTVAQPAGPPRRDPASIDTRFCSVLYVAGHQKDAAELAQFVTQATAASTAYFAELSPDVLWRGVSCRVHQMELASSLANADTSTIVDGAGQDDYSGDVFVLSLSAYRRTRPVLASDEARDNRRKVLTHELSTIPLDRATAVKGAGWRFHSAPPWFTQGYEEWFAIFQSTPEIKHKATRAALEKVSTRRESIRWEGTLTVEDPYSAGFVLVWFLHEKLGDAAMRKILASHQETFAAAFREAIGVEPASLKDELWRWVDGKAR